MQRQQDKAGGPRNARTHAAHSRMRVLFAYREAIYIQTTEKATLGE